MDDRIRMMRAVLDEAAREIKPSTATQAKMAQTIVVRAAEGATREELKIAALDVGKNARRLIAGHEGQCRISTFKSAEND